MLYSLSIDDATLSYCHCCRWCWCAVAGAGALLAVVDMLSYVRHVYCSVGGWRCLPCWKILEVRVKVTVKCDREQEDDDDEQTSIWSGLAHGEANT